jgi:hypothetical protein
LRLTIIRGHPPLLLQYLLSTHSFAGAVRRKKATAYSPAAKRKRKIRRRKPNAYNTHKNPSSSFCPSKKKQGALPVL